MSNKLEIKTKIIEEEMAVIGKWSMPLHSDRHSGQIPVAGDDTTEKTKALGWRISAFVNLNFQNTFFFKKNSESHSVSKLEFTDSREVTK